MKKHLRFFGTVLLMVLFSYGVKAQVISESFETWPPAGWTISPSSGSGSWAQDDGSSYGPGTSNIYDGSYAAMFDNYNYSSGTTGDLITPTFDVSSVTNPTLSFYWWNDDGSSTPATIDVYTSTDGTTYTLLQSIQTYGSGATTWVHYTHAISTSVVKIKLTATSDYGYKNTFVDKFVIQGVSCPDPSAQTESSITTTTASLGWTENGSATTWDIEYGPTGFTQGSGTTITGTSTNPHNLTGLSAATSYDWYVRADCGGGSTSNWVGPSTFTTALGPHSFPLTEDFESGFTYFNNAAGNGTDFADETTLYHGGSHSVKNAYGANETNILFETGKLDLSSTSNAVLEFWHIAKTEGGYDKCYVEISTDGGSTYTALPNSVYQGSASDYSSKGYFHEDSYTTWGTSTGTPDNTWWKKEKFSLSSYNVANVSFRFKLTSDGSAQRDGWTIDDIHIYEPSCPDPSAQNESSVTSSSARLGWTENGSASQWDIEYGPTGFTQGSGTTITGTTTNPHNLTGLSAATTYDWYVRADCGGGSTSNWVGPSTFTTACTTKSTPWTDDVEAHSATTNSSISNCWSSNPSGTTSDFRWDIDASGSTPSGSTGPSGAYNGSKYFYTEASSGSSGDVAELYSPNIDLSGLTSPMLEFYYHMYGAAMGDLHVDVYDGTWHNDVMTAISGQQQTAASDPWLKQTVDLSSYSGTIQIRFRGVRGSSYTGDMSLDNISVKEAPTCPDPTAQTETNITLNSVDLGWTENGSATTWDIEWGATGFTQGSGTTVSGVTANPYTLSGLSPNTTYDWYVRADCGSGSTSNWTGPHSFTTADGKATNPTPSDGASGVLVSATTLDWDDVTNATGYHISVGTTSGGTDIVNNASCGTSSQYTVSSNWSYATTYYWTVTTDYSGGTVTGDEWTFTSECSTYSSFPYTQDFSSWTPVCWETDHNTTGSSHDWIQYSSGSTNAARANFWGQTGGSTDIMVSPTFDVSGLTTPSLDFKWSHKYNSSYPDDSLSVEITDDGGTSWHQVWTKGGSNLESNDGAGNTAPGSFVNSGDIDLSAYGNTIQIRFYATSGYGPDLFIDDFRIREMPTCTDPTAQTETNITTSGADLGWTDNAGASAWDIEYGPTGFTQGSGTMVNGTSSNPYSLSGLTSNTTYDWYVRADCGGGSTSSWVGPHSFTTTALAPGCATSPTPADAATGVTAGTVTLSWTAPVDDATHDAATSYDVYFGTTSGSLSLEGNTSNTTYDVSASMDLTNYYWKIVPKNSAGDATGCPEWSFTTAVTQSATTQTAPWSDDFSTHSGGTGTTTNGWLTNPTSGFAWTISTNGGTTSSNTGPSADNSGDDHFIFTEASNGSQGSVAVLYSPKLDLSALTTPELTFYYHMYGATMGNLHIDVYNGSAYTNDVATALSGQQQSAQGDAWLKYTVDLSSYSGTIHIRFRGIRGSSYTGDMSIDDFDIHEAPACPDPTAQTETNITTSGADLGWTDASGSHWDIYVTSSGGAAPVQATTPTADDVTSNPYTWSGGSAYTTYDWYVRSDCDQDNTGTSAWIGPHSFTTSKIVSSTLAGKTSKCSPQFQRPNQGTPPTTQSSTTVFYDKYSVTIGTSGNYDILANWSYDGYLHIYENSFDPANPMTNVIGGDDDNDNGGGSAASGSKIEGVSLTAGTTYIIVGSAYNSGYGDITFWIEGAGSVTMPSATDHFGYPYRTYTVPSTDGTTRTSDYECDDANGWTTYYDDNGTSSDYTDDNLLLAVKKNGNNLGATTVTVSGSSGASWIAPSTTFSKYVNSFQGWYVFNRYWELTPTTQPSTDVDVRFYYKDADFSDLQTALTNAGKTAPSAVTDLSVVKINDLSSSGYDPDPANGHNNIPKATSYDADGAWIYNAPSGSAAASTKWTDGSYGSDHYFEFTVAHFSGGGGGAAGNSNDGSLPIELLSFNAFAKGDINQIVWKTASEYNVDRFIVERMNPSTKDIEEIGAVKAVGNSNVIQSYSFDDNQPLEEAYYRIRNVDYDGATESFDWVYVKRGVSEFKLINMYPNPVQNTAHIELVNPTANAVRIEIRDMVGKVILSKEYKAQDGLQKIDLDLSSISAGTYYISFDNMDDHLMKLIIIR